MNVEIILMKSTTLNSEIICNECLLSTTLNSEIICNECL